MPHQKKHAPSRAATAVIWAAFALFVWLIAGYFDTLTTAVVVAVFVFFDPYFFIRLPLVVLHAQLFASKIDILAWSAPHDDAIRGNLSIHTPGQVGHARHCGTA
jgi:hypothetical protein